MAAGWRFSHADGAATNGYTYGTAADAYTDRAATDAHTDRAATNCNADHADAYADRNRDSDCYVHACRHDYADSAGNCHARTDRHADVAPDRHPDWDHNHPRRRPGPQRDDWRDRLDGEGHD